jgi:hypothetical protein
MNPYRLKALEGLLDYLSGLQGGDLKSLMDGSQKPMEGDPMEESMESPKDEMLEDKMGMDGKPKGISVEKVAIMGEKPKLPGMPEEMEPGKEMPEESGPGATDDELEELYNKFRK